MEPFVEKDDKIIVNCYAVELYLPAEYADMNYRGTPYYAILGVKVKYLGIGNFRFFNSEKEMEHPEEIPTYPYVVPMLLTAQPTDIEVRDVQFKANGRIRKCIVLTFIKGDEFLCNTNVIKSGDPVMMYMARLEGGKLDHIPPEVAISGLHDAEEFSGISLRIPAEDEEVFVSARYRNPRHPTQEYRYYDGPPETDKIISNNARTDAQQMGTFAGVMFEDINNTLITSVNRANRGEVGEVTPFEAVVRGLPMDKWIEADIPPEPTAPPVPVVTDEEPEDPNMGPHND